MTPAWNDSLFMKAARCEPTPRTPIWLMRQAGRYMADYRRLRESVSFLELCRNPELCAEVMITTVERIGVDAAIIFSDLLLILEPMGLKLEFTAGEGPMLHDPVREAIDVDRISVLDEIGPLEYVCETVRHTRAGLDEGIPVIGFAGAPFTLAGYMIEGHGSRDFRRAKSFMYRDSGAWDALMGKLVDSLTVYLNAQIDAGAQAVQLFDSWVGCLGPADYRKYVLPHSKRLIESIKPGVPIVHFGTGNPTLLPLLTEAGGSVIGIDWRVDLADAWATVGHDRAVQGNLDPVVLLSTKDEIRRQAEAILKSVDGRPGHIFNLGHGVLPQTPVENVIALVDMVHEMSER